MSTRASVERAASLLEASDSEKLHEIAAWVRRTGVVTRRIGSLAAQLIQTCGLCEKPALYRYGLHGRCRTHKAAIPVEKQDHALRLEQKAVNLASKLDERDRVLRDRDKLRKLDHGPIRKDQP